MRRCAAQRTPGFGQRRHLLGARARLQAQSDFNRFLYGDIAGRPGIAMAEAEQEIDVGGPRPDAVQRGERIVRGVGILVRQHIEIEALGGEFARDILQGLDLCRRQPKPAETMDQPPEDEDPGASGTLSREAADALLREDEEADD